MLKSRLRNITNIPVTLDQFKSFASIGHNLFDADITIHLQNASIWVTRKSNVPAMDFDCVLAQDKEALEHELLFDNITVTSVQDLGNGDVLSYTENATKTKITLEESKPVLVNYSCTAESNDVLTNAVKNYALILYSGQTDKEAEMRIVNDLRAIQNEIY